MDERIEAGHWNAGIAAVGPIILPKCTVLEFDFEWIEIDVSYRLAEKVPLSYCGPLSLSLRGSLRVPSQSIGIHVIRVGGCRFIKCIEK
jgi:hypothetical protein